jgi:hypothetical protein
VAKNVANILSQLLDKKMKKKHGALVNGAKLGGTAPLTKASCFFPTWSRHTGQFLAPWMKALRIA